MTEILARWERLLNRISMKYIKYLIMLHFHINITVKITYSSVDGVVLEILLGHIKNHSVY